MAREQVEFEFPDPDMDAATAEIEIEDSSAEAIDLEDKTVEGGFTEVDIEAEEGEEEDELEIEVVNDVPEKDQNRTPSEPPADVTDEEMQDYSEKVRKRIKHFNKGYHDERRAKEQATREAAELQRVVRTLLEEKKQLSQKVQKGESTMITQARASVERDLAEAKEAFKKAHADGDSDALLEAEEWLSNARSSKSRIDNLEVSALHNPNDGVQSDVLEQRQRRGPAVPEQRAVEWQAKNPWFGAEDHEPQTAFALGVHKQLTDAGVDTTSNEYYDTLNSRMQKTFPELYPETDREERQTGRRTSTSVVAPATRTKAPKKARLSSTQVTIAKKLGLTLSQYAAQVALETRNKD